MQENRPVIALDFPEFSDVKDFLEKFDPSEQLYIKLGMELFYTAGPQVVYYVKSLGHSVFLDLKLHDIPNTVESSMRVLARLGVDMVNVHAAGGVEMMVAAKRGLEAGTPVGRQRPKLIAVTQLTSTSEEIMQNDQKIMTSLEESVINYTQKTAQAGLDGVVCSAHEVEKIKASMQDGSYKGDPILVAGDQLHIADGHHRWAAYGEMDEVPSHYIDLSFEDLYKFLDNKPYVLKRSIKQ